MSTSTESVSTLPVVGTPASYSVGSDRYACTVCEVSRTGHRVVTRDAISKLCSGDIQSEQQRYIHADDPAGARRVFTRRANGTYRAIGSKYGQSLSIGQYSAYRDPSF